MITLPLSVRATVPLVTVIAPMSSTSYGLRMSLSGAGSRPCSSASTVNRSAVISASWRR